MANAAFILLVVAVIVWLYASGKLGAILGAIKTNP